jgi:hypothetical protein
VVARPCELDWLLDSDETPLSGEFLDAFDDIRLLRYRPDAATDRERTVDCCRSIPGLHRRRPHSVTGLERDSTIRPCQ